MSAAQELAFDTAPPTSIVKLVETTPSLVLIDIAKFEEFYEEIVKEVRAFVPDLTSVSGRKEIASLAYKVARTKTAIDEAGKKLTEDKRKEIKVVDESRRVIRERLDALKDEARKPLTEWEEAEKNRVDYCKAIIQHIKNAGNGLIGGEPQPFGILLHDLEEKVVIDETFGEFRSEAEAAREAALSKLRAEMEYRRQLAAERAELEKLRAEKEERERAEAERKAAEEAKQAKAEAKKREAERAARQAEEDRQRLAAAEAAARKRAEDAAAAREREIEEAAAERERLAAAAHAAEINRLKSEQEARDREAARVAQAKADEDRAEREEAERRAKDREHRGVVMGAAKEALMAGHSLSEAKAKAIVLAIAAGNVPNVSIRF